MTDERVERLQHGGGYKRLRGGALAQAFSTATTTPIPTSIPTGDPGTHPGEGRQAVAATLV